MMPPGHIAATWGVATLLHKNNSRLARLDYRLLAVSALLPDLIDKPLAILVFKDAQTSQLIAHSLLINMVFLVLTLLFWRKILPYTLAFNAHLIADRMWQHTESFWWPVFGWDTFWTFKPMNTPETMYHVYVDIITRYPQVWVIELIAIFYLIWLAYRHSLYRWTALKQFIRTGHLNFLHAERQLDSSQNQRGQTPVQPVATQTPGSGYISVPIRPKD